MVSGLGFKIAGWRVQGLGFTFRASVLDPGSWFRIRVTEASAS